MRFEELDYAETELGALVLRRRDSPSLGANVYEVTLDGEFLMSSVVNDTELALADLALARCAGSALSVCVGGLGLGYSAARALDDPRVRELQVVELLAPVLDWHERGLVPLGERLCKEDRCRFVQADFFVWIREQSARFDAVLIDIDHSPDFLLSPRNAEFWEDAGPAALARSLKPGGVLAVWSADPPSEDFVQRFEMVFERVEVETIDFDVPQLETRDENSILLASAVRG